MQNFLELNENVFLMRKVIMNYVINVQHSSHVLSKIKFCSNLQINRLELIGECSYLPNNFFSFFLKCRLKTYQFNLWVKTCCRYNLHTFIQ